MPAFLEQFADDLYERHQSRLSELCIVFPTRRAGLFFKKYLSEKISTPLWLPKVTTIRDFMRGLSGKTIPDQLELLLGLFMVYQKYFPGETFEKYYPWGEILLRDFDEADRNLADTGQLFRNIREEGEIDQAFDLPPEEKERIREFWKTFFNREEGKLRNEFLENWKHLGVIYTEFRSALLKNNNAYEGLAFRLLAEDFPGAQPGYGFDKIVFTGFYALSKAEEKIIDALVKMGIGELYWDTDSYYADDPRQEAGTFIRNNRLIEPGYKWKQSFFESEEKNISVFGVPFQVGQAEASSVILEELSKGTDFLSSKTAIVLPDEHMLFPVMNSLPGSIEAFNVTMGFPLSTTPVFSLLESLVQLHKNARKRKDGSISYYQRHVLSVLSHPVVMDQCGDFIRTWMKKYREQLKRMMVPAGLLVNDAPPLMTIIFSEVPEPGMLPGYFKNILRQLLSGQEENDNRNDIETEYTWHFYLQLQRLEDVLAKFNQPLSAESFWNLYKEIIRADRVPFSGEPLNGLQIMGFLETRLLDFDNLFILSVNEDTLPPSSHQPSFIPYNLRKAFGLPASEEQQAVASYHFYRMIQRAKNIYLFYNTESKSITAGEKSRYILQIEHELKKKFPGKINFHSGIVSTPFTRMARSEITIPKTDEVMQLIGKYVLRENRFNEFSPRFSASGLITYLSCPLKFYFKYLVKIKETEELEENIEAATFGKILHKAMQLLYAKNANLTDSVLTALEKEIPATVDQAVREIFLASDELEGKDILIRNVIIELCRKIIRQDKKDVPVIVHHLEESFMQPLQVTEQQAVLLYGIIDRVDEVNGQQRIIDYKTGKVDARSPSDLEMIFTNADFKEYFQAYFYAWLYHKKSGKSDLKSGLVTVKNMSDGILFLNKGELISDDQFRQFESRLGMMIREILDPSKPIYQAEDEKRCLHCGYKTICHR